ncbi:hypothetical protein CNR22_23430 [Sphingobacteriaceae bacterium]|nr:hypothetical protein CNR22_23430 [Sphingobacteriaceae bacterium]
MQRFVSSNQKEQFVYLNTTIRLPVKLNAFILLIFLPLNSFSQTVISKCNATSTALKLYKNDADRMAIRRVNHIGSSYKDSVTIDKQLSEKYLKALVAVNNATALSAVDTITRLLNIHTYNPGLNSLIVMADSNLVWMTNLRYNILPTRDYTIDKMMQKYGLEKHFYSGLMQPNMVVFRTDTNSNLVPLARKLKSALGVKAAESEFMYGDGNDITDSVNSKYTELTYSYGWQECSTGCEQRRFWKFRVYSDCSVEYMGSYGQSLIPALILSVQENESLFTDIYIYPNPVSSKLYIACNAKRSTNPSLTITNKAKEVVYTSANVVNGQQIDLFLLPNGNYTLKLESNSQKKVFFLKVRS